MKALYLALLPFLLPTLSFADVASDWSSDVAFAQGAEGAAAGNSSAQINQSESIPGFSNNPSEESYYNNPNGIPTAADVAATTDPNAQNMVGQFNSGNDLPVNSNSPMVQTGNTIQQNISGIISGTYPGCTQQQSCPGGYQEHTCETSRSQQLNCTNTLNVTVNYQPYPFDCNHLVADNSNVAYYTEVPGPDGNGNCVTGFTQVYINVGPSSKPFGESGSMQATLPPNVSGTLFMTLRGLDYNGDFKPQYDHLSLAVNGNGLPSSSIVNPKFANADVLWGTTTSGFKTPNTGALVNVSYSYNLSATGDTAQHGYYFNPINGIKPATMYIIYPYTAFNIPSVSTAWVNSCGTIPSMCNMTSQTCTDNSGTKTINGDPVTEPCWQYSQVYQCNGPSIPAQDSCAPYQNTCNPISSTCDPDSEVDGYCLVQNVTYSCPNGPCSSNLVCGMDEFCVSGDCYTPTPSQSTDFGKDDSEMAAVTGAMQSAINSGSETAFTGDAQSCRESILGYINCCSDSGWGINIGLSNCSAAEKELGQAREQGRAIQVGGSYCSSSTLGLCTEHSEGYCIFPDLISYDVQVQGRLGQLGISFGQNSSPDCSGISIPNLQKINFSLIDFSNVQQEIESQATFPESGTTQTNVEKEIQNMEQNFNGGGQ